jgi:hypothetical protein
MDVAVGYELGGEGFLGTPRPLCAHTPGIRHRRWEISTRGNGSRWPGALGALSDNSSKNSLVPSAGLEPALPAPEAGALSAELRGLGGPSLATPLFAQAGEVRAGPSTTLRR